MTLLIWMAYASATSILFGVVAVLLEQFGASTRGKRWIWFVSILLSLFVVAWSTQRTDPSGNVSSRAEIDFVGVAAEMQNGTAPFASVQGATDSATGVVTPAYIESRLAWQLQLLALSLLLVPVLILAEHVQIARRRRSWREAEIESVPVLISADFGPAVVGVWTPRIVVPESVLDMSDTERRLLLTHEQEHMRAHDGRFSFFALMCVALNPWNVGMWWQYARFRQAIEIDCDQRVLARDPHVREYADLLLRLASSGATRTMHATALVDGRESLRRRVLALASVAAKANRVWIAVAGLAFGAVASSAWVAPHPRSPVPQLFLAVQPPAPTKSFERALVSNSASGSSGYGITEYLRTHGGLRPAARVFESNAEWVAEPSVKVLHGAQAFPNENSDISLRAVVPTNRKYGRIVQYLDARSLYGKRIVLSGEFRVTAPAKNVRVEGIVYDSCFRVTDYQQEPEAGISGSTEWVPFRLVLDLVGKADVYSVSFSMEEAKEVRIRNVSYAVENSPLVNSPPTARAQKFVRPCLTREKTFGIPVSVSAPGDLRFAEFKRNY